MSSHSPDLFHLYKMMLTSRLFEEAVKQLWGQGLISGEMHLGTGEEAVVAGVMDHLRPGDALALDHRGTSALLLRGVDPVSLLREFLGREDGLCRGRGGHMHLFAPDRLAASSGIVGSSGPAAAGFALAAARLRPETVAVSFFGEGAMNQGMMLESMNLASVWRLPVAFICKDNSWAITTRSAEVTVGMLPARARAFGLRVFQTEGPDVETVWWTAREALDYVRKGKGPVFFLAPCLHLEGHLLGDPLLAAARRPFRQGISMAAPLVCSFFKEKGARLGDRLRGMSRLLSLILQSFREQVWNPADPLARLRDKLAAEPERLGALEETVWEEIRLAVKRALQPG